MSPAISAHRFDRIMNGNSKRKDDSHSISILKSQLETVAKFYKEVANSPHPVDRLLGNFFHRFRKRFGSRDRKVISETCYGIFRHKLLIESWISQRNEKIPLLEPLAALAAEGLIDAKTFSELWPCRGAEELYQGLKNKQLPASFFQLNFEESLSRRFSFPLELVKRWLVRFGEETCGKLLQAMNERPPLILRVNPLRISRDELIGRLSQKGHEALPGLLSPWGVKVLERFNVFEMEEFKQGFFEVQDEGSQLVALAVDPRPGEIVWDACAGGGGKTLILAALMKNKGRVIATDIRPAKLADLRKRAKRAGIFNVFPADLKRLDQSSLFKRGVDRILIDAPCSGTGTLRRNPDAKWKLSLEKLAACQKDQRQILEQYYSYLKPGGRLVYATCSIEPEENEAVVEDFLGNHPEFHRGRADQYLTPHENGTDGFYIACLLRSQAAL